MAGPADQIDKIAQNMNDPRGLNPQMLAFFAHHTYKIARVAADLKTISGRFDEHAKIKTADEGVLVRLHELVSESKEALDRAADELFSLILEPDTSEDEPESKKPIKVTPKTTKNTSRLS